MEETRAARRDEVKRDAVSACRLSGNREVVRIAAEGRNLIANPRSREIANSRRRRYQRKYSPQSLHLALLESPSGRNMRAPRDRVFGEP